MGSVPIFCINVNVTIDTLLSLMQMFIIDTKCERILTSEIFSLQLKIKGQFTLSESERESEFFLSFFLPLLNVNSHIVLK